MYLVKLLEVISALFQSLRICLVKVTSNFQQPREHKSVGKGLVCIQIY